MCHWLSKFGMLRGENHVLLHRGTHSVSVLVFHTTFHSIRLVPRLHLVIVKGGLQNELGWQLTTTRHVCCLVVSLPSHILSVCITMRCESDERHLHHITPDNMVVNTTSHNIVRDGELLSPTSTPHT